MIAQLSKYLECKHQNLEFDPQKLHSGMWFHALVVPVLARRHIDPCYLHSWSDTQPWETLLQMKRGWCLKNDTPDCPFWAYTQRCTHTQAHIHAYIHNMHMSIPMWGLSLNQNLKYLDKVVRDPIPGIQVPHPSPLSLH